MSLIWHIVRKDFRRLAGPLALWLLLVLGHAALPFEWQGQEITTPASMEGKRYFVMICGVIVMGIGFILAAWLVMEDNLVSTAAFWRTRPVHGLRLLTAKALGALLMLSVLPVVVLTPVWLGCGFSFRELAHAAWEVAAGQALCSLAAFALAGITETSGQFLIRLVGAAIAWPIFMGYVLGNFHGYKLRFPDAVVETRTVLVLALLALIPLVMTVHQFLTRRMMRTCLLLAGGLALMVVGGCWWPWGQAAQFRPQAAGRGAQVPAVSFVAQEIRTNFRMEGRVIGLVPGTHISVDRVFGEWSDGRPGPRLTGMVANRNPPVDVVRHVAGLPAPAVTEATWTAWGREGRGVVEAARENQVKLGGTVRATVMRGIVLGEVPLRAGATFEVGSSSLRIKSVRSRDEKISVMIEERDAWLTADAGIYSNVYDPVRSRLRPAAEAFVVLNRGRKSEVMSQVEEIGTLKANSILVGRRNIVITPPAEDENWVEGAVLVKVRFVPEKEITQPLAGEPLALPR